MTAIYVGLAICGLLPIVRAWLANRDTTLVHSLTWAAAAWLAWGAALVGGNPNDAGQDPLRLLALFLTGAAGVAVFGARRPIVGAWNFVVLGLLGVLLLPLAETFFLGTPSLGPVRILFIAATLALGILNYIPTAFAPAALWFGVALTGECLSLFLPDLDAPVWLLPATHLTLLIVPWVAWASWKVSKISTTRSEIDRLWLDFRDRYGVVWGQRIREQFNRAAEHANWASRLAWQGIHALHETMASEKEEAEMLATLQSMLRRFALEITWAEPQ